MSTGRSPDGCLRRRRFRAAQRFPSAPITCAWRRRNSPFAWRATCRHASAPYRVEEVTAAIGALHPAIEIPDSRYDDFTKVGAAQLIADNGCAHLFVLGDAADESWRAIDLVAHPVRATNGAVTHDGNGGRVLGDPLVALTWLVNELSGLGITLQAGEVVTTGTCVTPLPIAAGDEVKADFGALGKGFRSPRLNWRVPYRGVPVHPIWTGIDRILVCGNVHG